MGGEKSKISGGPPPPKGGPMPPKGGPALGGAQQPAAGFTVQEFNAVVRALDPGLLFSEGIGGDPGRKIVVGDYAPEGWLLYFWFEARGSFAQHASFDQAKKVRAFFDKAFEKAADFATSKKIQPKGKLLDLFSASELREHLLTMLQIGFSRVDMGVDDTSDDMNRFKLMVGKKLKVAIFWRAEGRRGFDQLRAKGYTKQAHDETIPANGTDPCRRQAINCDKPWHPFSQVEVSGKLWFRRANSDNCWYTAVSIASQWQTSVCYPKIDQTPSMQILKAKGGKPPPVVDEDFRKKNKDLIGEVEFINGRTELRMVSRSKIAMVLVDDVVFDTQAKQEYDKPGFGYDEKAVSAIAGRNVVAMVQFWRVHHGADDSDGISVLVDHANCEKVNGMANLTRIFGDYAAAMAFSQQIDKAYDSAKQSPQFSLRWDSTGWAPMPAIPAVRRIKVDGKVVWTA